MTEMETTTPTKNFAFPETDVTLVVEGRKFHVNKAVLSEHSPVFNAMFKSQFTEELQRRWYYKTKNHWMLWNF